VAASGGTSLGDHADDEALLLNAVRLYRVRVLKDLAGVDELLLGHLPALVFLDLRLERADLFALLAFVVAEYLVVAACAPFLRARPR
jgi:hypothetical protein